MEHEYNLTKNEIRCSCGALIFDGFAHKSYLVEMINGDLVCPECGAVESSFG